MRVSLRSRSTSPPPSRPRSSLKRKGTPQQRRSSLGLGSHMESVQRRHSTSTLYSAEVSFPRNAPRNHEHRAEKHAFLGTRYFASSSSSSSFSSSSSSLFSSASSPSTLSRHRPRPRALSKSSLKLTYCYCYDCISPSPASTTEFLRSPSSLFFQGPSTTTHHHTFTKTKKKTSSFFTSFMFYVVTLCIAYVRWFTCFSVIYLTYHHGTQSSFFSTAAWLQEFHFPIPIPIKITTWPVLPPFFPFLCWCECLLACLVVYHELRTRWHYQYHVTSSTLPQFTQEQRWATLTECLHAIHPHSIPTSDAMHRMLMKQTQQKPPSMTMSGGNGKVNQGTVEHIGTFLSAWFFRAPPCQLQKENIKEWFAWAFFNLPLHEMGKENMEEVEAMLALLEYETGIHLEPGYAEQIKCIRLNLDEIRVKWFSGIFSVVVTCSDLIAVLLLKCLGYTSFRTPDNSAILHCPRHVSKNARPLLFFHGLGIGILPYFPLALYLYYRHRRPVLFVRIPSITVRVFFPGHFHPPPTPVILVPFLKKHLQRFSQVTVISHSMGTTFHAWLTTSSHVFDTFPRMSSIYIDPICFGLWWSQTAYAFVYQRPITPKHLVFRYFGARHTNIAHYLYKHFFWMQNILFPKVWQSPVVVLSELDFVVHPETIKQYLASEGVHCSYLKGIGHGGCLYSLKTWPVLSGLVEAH